MSSQFGSFLRSKNFSSIVESDLAHKEAIVNIMKTLTESENAYVATVSDALSKINEIKGVESFNDDVTAQLDAVKVEFEAMQKILKNLIDTLDKA